MRARLTAQSVEWLNDHKIVLHSKGFPRLAAGDSLTFQDDCEVEPYVGILAGNTICPLGFMSTSQSPLSPKMKIGRYCMVASGLDAHLAGHPLHHISTSSFTHNAAAVVVKLFRQDHPGDGPEQVADDFGPGPPVLEHDVWIGAHVCILPGVRIGIGAVVGAGSVVTRDVGPYEIVAGNPARLIRRRFPAELIDVMLETEWWRYKFTDFAGLPLDRPAEFGPRFLQRKADLEPYQPPKARLAEMPRA